MKKEDYKLIAMSIWRAGYIEDKNKVRQAAKERMRHLIAVNIASSLRHANSGFDNDEFMKDCGFRY